MRPKEDQKGFRREAALSNDCPKWLLLEMFVWLWEVVGLVSPVGSRFGALSSCGPITGARRHSQTSPVACIVG